MQSCVRVLVSRGWLRVSLCALACLSLLALEPSDDLAQYGRQGWQTGSGLPQDTVRAITQTRDGYLWVGTDEGLARFDGYRFAVYNTQNTPELKSNSILALASAADGSLLIATGAASVKFQNGRFGPSQTGLPSPKSTNLVDSHGVTWEGSASGLIRVVNGRTERLPASDPLSSFPVLALFEDSQGDLWAGTDGAGLQLLKNQRFTTVTTDPIRCVYQDGTGAVWFGTDNSGLKKSQNGVITAFTTANGLSSDVVLALASDRKGTLFAGTPDGLNVLHGGRFSLLTSADGLPEDFVRSLFTDADGSLWIGTRRGLAHLEGDRVTTYTQSNGLGSDLVGAMLRDKRGDLWVGTLRGLTRLHSGIFTNYTIADGLSSNVITDLYADYDGYLWIATQGGGLDRFKDELFAHFGPQQGLPETIYGITEDGSGNLWMSSRDGIVRVAKREVNAYAAGAQRPMTVSLYGTTDGLRVTEATGGGHPAIWKDNSGDIWFATARGAAFLSRAHTAVSRTAPPVVIESVLVDDDSVAPVQIANIGPEHARMSFEYAGIDFASPQRVRYRYKLEGFDKDWIEAGARRTAFYTNLPPRKYVFRVLARNGEGVWSATTAALAFRVLPHFYQTWWFRACLLASFGLAAFAVYTWRVRQVKAQFDAVLQERNRIAREIHDTLAQGFAGVSVQLEVVSRLMPPTTITARKHLDEARTLVRSCLADARRAIWDLRAPEAGKDDLAKKLSTLVRETSETSGISISLQIGGVYRSLEPQVEEHLLRIAGEALKNAARHSGASNITLDLKFAPRSVRMTVTDDGRGFDHQAVHSQGPDGHFGLAVMKERAKEIHAVLTVSSAVGQGTEINLEAPVR